MFKKEQAYLAAIGVLAVLLAATAAVALRGGFSAKSGQIANRPADVAPAAMGDESWFGIETVLVTPKRVVFEGAAKTPEVSQISVTVEGDNPLLVIVNPDPQTGAWTYDFDRTGLSESVRVSFLAHVGDRTVSIAKTVDISGGYSVPVAGANVLQVDWLSAPVSVTSTDIAAALGVPLSKVDPENDYMRSSFWRIGVVSGGEYAGDDLLLVEVPCEGPCFSKNLARMVLDRDGKRLVNLSAYGMAREPLFSISDLEGEISGYAPGGLVADDPKLLISMAGLPMRAKIAGSGYYIGLSDSESFFPDTNELEVIGKTENGLDIYSDKEGGCLYLRGVDLVYRYYDLELPFQGKTTEVTWNDTGASMEDYQHQDVGGCGAFNCWAVREERDLKPATSLVAAGKTLNGETIYGRKTDAEDRADALSDWPESMTGSEYAGTFDGAGKHLVFYWKDAFGRWIRFVKTTALPPVECGKPVIYLYPEKEMPVRVSVGLKGEMTVSEPPHGDRGWSVIARPDGYVTDVNDGKTYPNLYWEGTGVGYEIPKRGFVVNGSETDSWLEETLAKIGFTGRESAEFREFWVPRLPKTPYVFITFVDQKHFDRDAPIRITPKPDSVTRVFMEYRGLTAPISVLPLALPKIEREGFAVVEWGGALK